VFLRRVLEHLSGNAKAWHLDSGGRLGSVFFPIRLPPDMFYGLNADAMLAMTHAIEEFAMEDARGRLMVSFQDFRHFGDHGERYEQLSATLDEVTVLGVGRKPCALNRVRFQGVDGTALRHYWIVVYRGRRHQAVLAGRQVNKTGFIPHKRFVGFYSFVPSIIERLWANVETVADGRAKTLHEFDRWHSLDLAVRRLEEGFQREKTELVNVLKTMRCGRAQQDPGNFPDSLDASLQRLSRMKEQMPSWLSPHTSNND
jgi:hypothetical protein